MIVGSEASASQESGEAEASLPWDLCNYSPSFVIPSKERDLKDFEY